MFVYFGLERGIVRVCCKGKPLRVVLCGCTLLHAGSKYLVTELGMRPLIFNIPSRFEPQQRLQFDIIKDGALLYGHAKTRMLVDLPVS
jgi:hypothetical protein